MPSQNFEDIIQKVRKRESFAPVYKTIVLNLATATAEEVVNIAGGYFQVIDATDTLANIQIKFNENSHDQITLRKGDAVITPFYKTFISWAAQAGKTVTIAISADFDLWRIDRSAQIISTIDSVATITNPVTVITAAGLPVASKDWVLDRALNGQCFAVGYTLAASPGNYGHLQLYNPPGSGKTCVVLDAWLDTAGTAAAASQWSFELYNTALPTNIGGAPNLNSGGVASSSLLKSDVSAASSLGGGQMGNIGLPANGSVPQYIPDIHAVLGEGEGFAISCTVVNAHIRTKLRFLEF